MWKTDRKEFLNPFDIALGAQVAERGLPDHRSRREHIHRQIDAPK